MNKNMIKERNMSSTIAFKLSYAQIYFLFVRTTLLDIVSINEQFLLYFELKRSAGSSLETSGHVRKVSLHCTKFDYLNTLTNIITIVS